MPSPPKPPTAALFTLLTHFPTSSCISVVWVCYGTSPSSPGAARAATANVFGTDGCAGLGDRLRGIEYLARVAAGVKRVLLVYQESPVPLERFLAPAAIDWRLTPDLGIDVERELVHARRHFRIVDGGPNRLRQAVLEGTFQALTDRVVTVSTNRPASTAVGGPVPPLDPSGPLYSTLARALFQLSPEVEEATQVALAAVGLEPSAPFLALHLRLGGQTGERYAVNRFGQPAHALLAAATACAANATAAAAAGALPHLLVTDNAALRAAAAERRLEPWVSPPLAPLHFRLGVVPKDPEEAKRRRRRARRQQRQRQQAKTQLRGRGAGGSSDDDRGEGRGKEEAGGGGAGGRARGNAGGGEEGDEVEGGGEAEGEEAVRLHMANMADFGLLVKARCVVLSRSGYSEQAALLGGQTCVVQLADCVGGGGGEDEGAGRGRGEGQGDGGQERDEDGDEGDEG
ncbi:hypothetical protein HYH03_002915 [Edaphochlamys debaryana]|uniref:O-fucosyltransferase family protein n=1 Tax=Edaphochlamys debaryana TaxID=47281 RepID=A0A835YKG4_9CHLO|nr:hypothetical protein HYH03_002915 [Edaphochlamys debaryana]|eukprot:KAG2499339.1 hypothetical protein HYH03_002915 [Edaphochlamys debaryana]